MVASEPLLARVEHRSPNRVAGDCITSNDVEACDWLVKPKALAKCTPPKFLELAGGRT